MPDTLTEAQLAFFTEQTQRAVNKALRYARIRALTAFVILLVGVGISIETTVRDSEHARRAIVVTTRNVATAGCNQRYRDRVALRGIIRRSEGQIKQYVKDGTLTPTQGVRAVAQSEDTISKLPLPDCRQAQRIITDDPDHILPNHPAPLYPRG